MFALTVQEQLNHPPLATTSSCVVRARPPHAGRALPLPSTRGVRNLADREARGRFLMRGESETTPRAECTESATAAFVCTRRAHSAFCVGIDSPHRARRARPLPCEQGEHDLLHEKGATSTRDKSVTASFCVGIAEHCFSEREVHYLL